jgi:hypothetical protein
MGVKDAPDGVECSVTGLYTRSEGRERAFIIGDADVPTLIQREGDIYRRRRVHCIAGAGVDIMGVIWSLIGE